MQNKGKLIGTGLFTKCYEFKGHEKSKVVLVSTDYVKESFSMSWVTPSQLFPRIKAVETLDTDKKVYYMDRFKTGKASAPIGTLNKKNLELYYELKKINKVWGLGNLRRAAMGISNDSFREMFLDALNYLTNWGDDMVFDFRPSSIAIQKGKLILVDVFFFEHQRRKVYSDKKGKGGCRC